MKFWSFIYEDIKFWSLMSKATQFPKKIYVFYISPEKISKINHELELLSNISLFLVVYPHTNEVQSWTIKC